MYTSRRTRMDGVSRRLVLAARQKTNSTIDDETRKSGKKITLGKDKAKLDKGTRQVEEGSKNETRRLSCASGRI